VAKKLSGEASDEEMRDLETLLRSNPELHYSIQTISDLWHSHHTEDSENVEANTAFDKHLERMQMLDTTLVNNVETPEMENTSNRRKKFWFFGLSGILCVALIFFGLRMRNNTSEASGIQKNQQ
jgi:transmembrane sensor